MGHHGFHRYYSLLKQGEPSKKHFHNLRTNELISNRHHQLCITLDSPGLRHVFSNKLVTGSSGHLDWFTSNFLESRLTAVLLLAGALYLSLFALGAEYRQRPVEMGGVHFNQKKCNAWWLDEDRFGPTSKIYLLKMWKHRQVATCPFRDMQSLCAV